MFLRLKVLLSQKKKKQKIKSAHSSGRHSSCHLWPLLLGAWWHLAARPSLLMQLLRDLHHLVYYSEKCITLMYPNCICFLCTQICTTLYTPPCIEVPKLYRGTQICTQIFWWFLFSVLLTKMHFLNFCCQKLYVQSPEQLCLCWDVCENCHRCCVVWFFMLRTSAFSTCWTICLLVLLVMLLLYYLGILSTCDAVAGTPRDPWVCRNVD